MLTRGSRARCSADRRCCFTSRMESICCCKSAESCCSLRSFSCARTTTSSSSTHLNQVKEVDPAIDRGTDVSSTHTPDLSATCPITAVAAASSACDAPTPRLPIQTPRCREKHFSPAASSPTGMARLLQDPGPAYWRPLCCPGDSHRAMCLEEQMLSSERRVV